jgi:hypothetical protein
MGSRCGYAHGPDPLRADALRDASIEAVLDELGKVASDARYELTRAAARSAGLTGQQVME